MVKDFDNQLDKRALAVLREVDNYNQNPTRDNYYQMLNAVYGVGGKPVFDGYYCTGFGSRNGFYPVHE